MAKGELLTVGCTAVAIAAGFLLSGPIVGCIFLVIGFIFLAAYFQHQEKPEDSISVLGDISPIEPEPPRFDAERYIAEKKAVDIRFLKLSHGAREVLSLLSLAGATTIQNVTAHLVKFKFPEAERIFDDLKNDSVSFVVSRGLSEFGINPALARIVKEAVTEDEARFVEEEEKMSGDEFGKKIKSDPGYAARYNAIFSRLRGENFLPLRASSR